jgi:ABC-2 type transport system ATP-binding protein/lipopolysaccharide transport system ATP-binding protein
VCVDVLDAVGRAAEVLRRDQPFSIDVKIDVRRPVAGIDLAIYVESIRGVRVFDEMLSDSRTTGPEQPGCYLVRLQVPPVLNVGDYQVGVWVGTSYGDLLQEDDTARFALEGGLKGRPTRVVELMLPWEMRRLGDLG